MPFDPRTSLKTVFPNNHPEIVWYRLRVKVPPNESGLALYMSTIAPAFEIFANGQRILQSGQVAPFVGYTLTARLLAGIPDSQTATGSVLIALRVRFSPIYWDTQSPGLTTGRLSLGQETSLREHIWLKTIGWNLLGWVNQFATLGLGIVALALFASQRSHLEYLWIFLGAFVSALTTPLRFYEGFHNVPSTWDAANNCLSMAGILFLILMYFAFLRIPFGMWMRAFLAVAFLGYAADSIGIAHGALGLVWVYLAFLPIVLLIAGAIPCLLIVHFRRGNREAGILLIPVILYSLNYYILIALGLLGQVHAFAAAVDHANDVL